MTTQELIKHDGWVKFNSLTVSGLRIFRNINS